MGRGRGAERSAAEPCCLLKMALCWQVSGALLLHPHSHGDLGTVTLMQCCIGVCILAENPTGSCAGRGSGARTLAYGVTEVSRGSAERTALWLPQRSAVSSSFPPVATGRWLLVQYVEVLSMYPT